MAHNIGQMFYFGERPWHTLGTKLAHPANVLEALAAGGLDWEVDLVPIIPAGEPNSEVAHRVAVVRKDRAPGEAGRVIGVVHPGFIPLQNRQGAMMLDALLGHGQRVYHIYRDRVETTNAAIPHGHGPIRPDRFTPYPKNPTLSKFFMQMGRGEELGSGILNVNKYLPFYTKGAKPQFIEGDPFVTIIPLPTEVSGETTRKLGGGAVEKTVEKTVERILMLLRSNPRITQADIASETGLSRRGVEWNLRELKENGRIKRIGPDKGGRWEVLPASATRKEKA